MCDYEKNGTSNVIVGVMSMSMSMSLPLSMSMQFISNEIERRTELLVNRLRRFFHPSKAKSKSKLFRVGIINSAKTRTWMNKNDG